MDFRRPSSRALRGAYWHLVAEICLHFAARVIKPRQASVLDLHGGLRGMKRRGVE